MAQSSAESAKVIASYTTFLRGNYCSVAARVLFLWDYVITLGDEIHYVWERKLTAATVLFMLNRYVNLLVTILELFEQGPFQTAKVCGIFVRVLQASLVLALFIVAAFATLRVYATWNCNWKAALPVLLLAMFSPIGNIVIDIGQIPLPAPPPSSGCAVGIRMSPALYTNLIIANRASTSAYDGLVLLFTLIRTVAMKKQAMHISLKRGLIGLLIRDGTMYFVSLFFINIAQIIITSQVSGNNYLSYFVSPFTSILISRFLLNLRRMHGTVNSASASTYLDSELPSIRFEERGFASFAGDLVDDSDYSETIDEDGKDRDLELDDLRVGGVDLQFGGEINPV